MSGESEKAPWDTPPPAAEKTNAPAKDVAPWDTSPPDAPKAERPWYSVTPGGVAEAFKSHLPSMPEGDPNRAWNDVSAEGLKQGFKNALPVAGMALGVAAPEAVGLGALAKVIGSGLGSMGGEAARGHASGETPTREEYYKGLGSAALGGASAEMGIQTLGAAGKGVAGKLKSLPAELSGIDSKIIENYSERTDKVLAKIADNQSEGKFSSQMAVNHMRENVLNDVERTTRHLNSEIDTALSSAPDTKVFPVQPIVQSLEAEAANLHPVYKQTQIKSINDLISEIKKSGPNGLMSVQDLQATKQHLYDVARGAYDQKSKFFGVGTEVANAAKSAGAEARNSLDKFGPPAIKNANRQLAQLHEIESALGSSALDVNKPPSSIMSVGSGSNPRDALALSRLGEVTGGNYIQDARDIATAGVFANAPVTPYLKTGKSLYGPLVGEAIGRGAGGLVSEGLGRVGGALGAHAGAALSSPAMIKYAIERGNAPAGVSRSIMTTMIRAGVGKKDAEKVQNVLNGEISLPSKGK